MKQDTSASTSIFSALTPPEGVGAQQLPKGGAQRLKHGTKREDGKVFWGYNPLLKSGEEWISAEKFSFRVEERRKYARRKWAEDPKFRKYSREANKRLVSKPGYKERANATRRNRYKQDAAYREKIIARVRRRAQTPQARKKNNEWSRKRRIYSPRFRIASLLRVGIRKSVKCHAILRPRRKAPIASVSFLLWLADYLGVPKNFRGFDVDHLIPLTKFDHLRCPYGANDPENVRWLDSRVNRNEKRDRMPTRQELEQHFSLVSKWKLQTKQ